MPISHTLIHGNLFDHLATLPEDYVDTVITSPPYAQQRQKQYGGIAEADYAAWTVRWMQQVRRVLKTNGNVAIVIRPNVTDGVISDYVLRTRLALREDGWHEIDELIWIKPTAPPLGHVGRPRRSWESILWFSRSCTPYCDPLANGCASDRIGLDSTKGMGDYLHDEVARPVGSGIARCRDYVSVATHAAHKATYNSHPAQFPEALVEWLLGLLTPKHGMVIDPFLGSGTTAVAAKRCGRSFWGSEINHDYFSIATRRVNEFLGIDEYFSW